MIFNKYSRFYDFFYKEKNYKEEINYLELIGDLGKNNSILDLGCGTGNHAIPLVLKGYNVTGIDISDDMICQAKKKAESNNVVIDFFNADIRSLSLDKKFDLVISMFAVISYQNNNSDLLSTFETARKHLKIGRYFIFDTWFGPAVLSQKPETRIKKIHVDNSIIYRIAEPEMDYLNNLVHVKYSILELKNEKVVDQIEETHSMRFFFYPEMQSFAKITGFELINIYPFLEKDRSPDHTDWNVVWIMKAI